MQQLDRFVRRPSTRRSIHGGPFLWAPLFVLLWASAVWAQPTTKDNDRLSAQNRSSGSKTFKGSSQVTLIEVPVNVTSRKGEPIRNLKIDNFRLLDSGKEQEIAGMEVVDLEMIQPGREGLAQAVDQLPAVARRHFLLLFDLSFSRPSSIIKARVAARDFVLEHLHPTDLAAVATFSLEHGPQLLVTFTPDRVQLARAIETLGAPDLLRNGRVVDPLRFVIDIPSADGELVDDGFGDDGSFDSEAAISQYLSVIEFQQEQARKVYERGRISGWARAMGDTARSLAAVDGRKHVVYFSEGFDGSLLLGRDASRNAEAVARDQRMRESGAIWFVDQDETFGNSSLQSDVETMLEEFRRADCLIQAVDIAGLQVETGVEGQTSNVVGTRLNDAQDALFYVASGTGGSLFEDANNLGEQLADVLLRNSVTYVLSFYPKQLKADGELHKLKVKPVGLPRGTRVSHRAGYYAPKEFKDLHPMEKALLASEAIAAAAPREDIDVQLLISPFRASPELGYVPVILEVDGESLLAGQSTDRLRLELYVYATNTRGEMRDFVTQVLSFDLTQSGAALRRTGVKYYAHLDLTPDDYLLRVLVRNADTGRTAVLGRPLTVPRFKLAQPQVLPPFFIEPANRWFMVREQRRSTSGPAEDTGVVYPFTLGGEPFVPMARPVLDRGGQSEVCVVAYNLGRGRLQLDASVVDAAGELQGEGLLSLVERDATGIEGLDRLRATFDVQDLSPGDYSLQVGVTNLETGAFDEGSIAFKVRGTTR